MVTITILIWLFCRQVYCQSSLIFIAVHCSCKPNLPHPTNHFACYYTATSSPPQLWHTSRLRLGVSAKALAKFWRLIGLRKYFFLFTIRKRRSVAFQPCITLGGVHWVGMGQNNDFLQKSGLKTLILAVMVLDDCPTFITPTFITSDIHHLRHSSPPT